MRMVSVWIVAVSCWQLPIWADAGTSASQAAMRPRDGRAGVGRCAPGRVEPVQLPAQPVDRASPLGDELLAVVDQQLDLPGRLVVASGRQVGFAQPRPGDRQRVDRVGLAQDTHGMAGAGQQPRWDRTTRSPAASRSGSSRPVTWRQSSTAHTRSWPAVAYPAEQLGMPRVRAATVVWPS
jgi:hypothetical protein